MPELQTDEVGHAQYACWNAEGRPEWVYIARSEDCRIIKIGITTNLRWKLGAVASSYTKLFRETTPRWHFLAVLPGSMEIEHAILQRFAKHVVRGGEWFAADEEIVEYAWRSSREGRFIMPRVTIWTRCPTCDANCRSPELAQAHCKVK